jgi:putative flippase GtrA
LFNRVLVRWPVLCRLGRPLRFGLVGISGLVVNTAVLWALVRLAGLPLLVASALASEVAILNNFMLNDRWTFRTARPGHSFGQRFLRFNGTALGGMALTMLVLAILTHYSPLPLLLANLLAIGSAIGWNYIANSRWTWRGSAPHSRGNQLAPPDKLPFHTNLRTVDRAVKNL